MLEKLKEMNELMIKTNSSDDKILKKHLIIRKILDNKNCFLKMDIEYAYSILRDLGIIEEDLKKVYCQLMNV